MSIALLDRDLAQLAETLRSRVVVVKGPHGNGAGTVWPGGRMIVTNAHVVEAEPVDVATYDDNTRAAAVIARDSDADLALLELSGPPLAGFPAVDAPAPQPGQLVFAVGHPWGQEHALSAGIVLSQAQRAPGNGVPLRDVILADLRLRPGNSGGPLVDAEARLLGINTLVSGGIAVAIAGSRVQRFVETARAERARQANGHGTSGTDLLP